jgi:hypothetical protein
MEIFICTSVQGQTLYLSFLEHFFAASYHLQMAKMP